jgi:hypothetical protein
MMGRVRGGEDTMQKADGRRRADADSRRWRISSRQAFRRVRRAYAEGREGGLQAAYADVRWRTRGIRPLLALADRMYPMTEAIELAGEMDRRIREDGLSSACAAGAERLGLDCEFVMSEATREVLTASPVIVYGNHPTMLTPFLIGASVRRPDLRFFMLSYVGHLVPSLRAYMLPLEIPSGRSWAEWRRGGNRRIVEHWLTQILEKGRERADAKPANRQILGKGAQHVAGGGCVVIFPSGGGRKDRTWYPGIGHLAGELARDPDAPKVFLVPMREEQSSNGHVYQGFRRASRGDRDASTLSPIRVRFGEPHRLADLVDLGDNARAIAAKLQANYEEIFPPARSRVLEWLFFPWRVAWGRSRA